MTDVLESDLFGDCQDDAVECPIPGLLILRGAVPRATCGQLQSYAASELDAASGMDQVHLVDNFPPSVRAAADDIQALLSSIPAACGAVELLRQWPLRQGILNLYSSSTSRTMRTHVDLLRFGPVVLGLGVRGQGVLRFTRILPRFLPIARGSECELAGKLDLESEVAVRIEEGDVYVMFGDARERWAHEVAESTEGRVSLTLRGLPLD